MKLDKKKQLAARTLGVGKERILFNVNRLDEIKEAITKQDIKDLYASKAISIKEIKGRRKKEKRRTRKGPGSIRKIPNKRKREYIIITRKLRKYLKFLKNKNLISKENFFVLRKEIRARIFKSLVQMKDRIKEIV